MGDSWQALESELQQWESPASLWWRDDDAIADTPALRRLLTLQRDHSAIALHLASIPKLLEESLPTLLHQNENVWVLQHGYNHQSNALAGQRSVELGGNQSLQLLIEKLGEGRGILEQAFGDRHMDILVPPWNRFSAAAETASQQLDYLALSGRGPRGAITEKPPRLNVHVDIIDWKIRSFVGVNACITTIVQQLQLRRRSEENPGEPLGLMTHHLDHDHACWDFLHSFISFTTVHPKINWLRADEALEQ